MKNDGTSRWVKLDFPVNGIGLYRVIKESNEHLLQKYSQWFKEIVNGQFDIRRLGIILMSLSNNMHGLSE